MGRATGIPPKASTAGSPAVTVKPEAGIKFISARAKLAQLQYLKWKAAEADRQLRQDDYPAWYAKQTSVNGCSIPEKATALSEWLGYGNWDAHTEACNRHDVNYGRGGFFMKPIADGILAYEIWQKGERTKAIATYVALRVGGVFNYSWLNDPGIISSGIRLTPLNTPEQEAAERAAAAKAEADKQAAAAAAHQAQLARGNEIIGGVLIPASPLGKNVMHRQALTDAGITDPKEQDQLLQDYFNRDKTDMK